MFVALLLLLLHLRIEVRTVETCWIGGDNNCLLTHCSGSGVSDSSAPAGMLHCQILRLLSSGAARKINGRTRQNSNPLTLTAHCVSVCVVAHTHASAHSQSLPLRFIYYSAWPPLHPLPSPHWHPTTPPPPSPWLLRPCLNRSGIQDTVTHHAPWLAAGSAGVGTQKWEGRESRRRRRKKGGGG